MFRSVLGDRMATCRRTKFDLYLSPRTKHKMIKKSLRPETLNLLEIAQAVP